MKTGSALSLTAYCAYVTESQPGTILRLIETDFANLLMHQPVGYVVTTVPCCAMF